VGQVQTWSGYFHGGPSYDEELVGGLADGWFVTLFVDYPNRTLELRHVDAPATVVDSYTQAWAIRVLILAAHQSSTPGGSVIYAVANSDIDASVIAITRSGTALVVTAVYTSTDYGMTLYGNNPSGDGSLICVEEVDIPTTGSWRNIRQVSDGALVSSIPIADPMPMVMPSATRYLSYTIAGGVWYVQLRDIATQALIAEVGDAFASTAIIRFFAVDASTFLFVDKVETTVTTLVARVLTVAGDTLTWGAVVEQVTDWPTGRTGSPLASIWAGGALIMPGFSSGATPVALSPYVFSGTYESWTSNEAISSDVYNIARCGPTASVARRYYQEWLMFAARASYLRQRQGPRGGSPRVGWGRM
jgi:hypothetical protein